MVDIPGLRMHRLHRIPDEAFTLEDQRVLMAVILDYGYQPSTIAIGTTRMDSLEVRYISETFDFEINVLGMNKRELLSGVSSHYSLAGKHPELVASMYRALLDNAYRIELLNRGYHLPTEKA